MPGVDNANGKQCLWFVLTCRTATHSSCHDPYCCTKHAVRAITEGLRLEHDKIRATLISPGVVATELGHDITDPTVADALIAWRKQSLTPDAIARAIRFALEQPEGVDINEIIVRPTSAGM